MKIPQHDNKATKQTVSITLNSDLYARAKKLGINTSQVAEQALEYTVAKRVAEQLKAEIQQDLAAYNAYVTEHGSPAEVARAYYD
ncbi:MAG: type II toxin-antitoxin system CcdA family antitoxin [Gammaproteobacteria bacterium]